MEHQPRAAQQDPATPWTAAPAETSASTHRPAGSTRQWSVTSTTHANRDFWGPHHQSSGSSSPVLTPFAAGLQPTTIHRIRPTWPGSRRMKWKALWDTLLNRRGWYIDKEWIPAFAGMTDQAFGVSWQLDHAVVHRHGQRMDSRLRG